MCPYMAALSTLGHTTCILTESQTLCKHLDSMNNLSCLFLFIYVQYVATYATVGQLGDDNEVCSCTVCA